MTNTANENIVIQDISDGNMTVNVNGEVKTIHKELAELKELLKNQNVSNITYENKIYNIEHINEANFGVVTSNKAYNGVLTKELILQLKDLQKPASFLGKLPTEDQENWEGVRQHLNEAQGILADSFVWVVGWELRRLFAIGNDKENPAAKVNQYITLCFTTYRVSLQLINFLFISKLWDEKVKNPGLDTNKVPLQNFFSRTLKLPEMRSLLQTLIGIFKDNKLTFPMVEADLGDIDSFMQDDSAFNKACAELEALEAMDGLGEAYGLGHCHTAEIALTAVLKSFSFLAKYQLVTIRRIEYEESRNSSATFIKDLNFLEKKESKDMYRILKYDNSPALTYSVFFRNDKTAVSLFPFLIDYNALTSEGDFHLYLYKCRDGESGLRYIPTRNTDEIVINYTAADKNNLKIEDEDQKNKLQKNIRLDMVVKQFEAAMNTILGTSTVIQPKSSEIGTDSLSNL